MLTWGVVHPNDDPVEHRYRWHTSVLGSATRTFTVYRMSGATITRIEWFATLYIRFPKIALQAERLQILSNGFSALAPCLNMIHMQLYVWCYGWTRAASATFESVTLKNFPAKTQRWVAPCFSWLLGGARRVRNGSPHVRSVCEINKCIERRRPRIKASVIWTLRDRCFVIFPDGLVLYLADSVSPGRRGHETKIRKNIVVGNGHTGNPPYRIWHFLGHRLLSRQA